jgi:stage II sporulation protein D
MSRRRRGSLDRKLAGIVIAMSAALAAVVGGFSCTTREARRETDFAIPQLKNAPVMRVALARKDPARATIEVRGPYEIFASEAADARPAFAGESLPPTELALEPAPGTGLQLAGYAFRPGLVRVKPKQPGTLWVDGVGYRGDLVARAVLPQRKVLVVNRVNLEEYTAGVVGSEMPLSFPENALRAQAIASRTYGLHCALGRTSEPYDVMDDQGSQVYKGLTNETDLARRVTVDTLGVVLTYGEKVLKAYFSSTCGDETVSAAWAFGDPPCPPLGGGPCGFCQDSKFYRWHHEIKRAELAQRLTKEGFPVASVTRLEVGERGPAGHVAWVRVVHPGGEVRVPAVKFRWLVGTSAIRATTFDIDDKGGDTIAFNGKGWGHGVGLCQIGARGMARAGHDAVAILRRYYPAAELRRIYSASEAPAAVGGGTGGAG